MGTWVFPGYTFVAMTTTKTSLLTDLEHWDTTKSTKRYFSGSINYVKPLKLPRYNTHHGYNFTTLLLPNLILFQEPV